MTGVPSVQALTAALRALLTAHPTLTVYTSIVTPAPPVDDDGVWLGYAVIHPGAGNDAANNLAITPGQLLWDCQITCVGGDVDYAAWTVDTVRGLLSGQPLTVSGAKVGRLQPPAGYTPPIRTQLELQPPRVSVPLQYQLLAVST